MTAAIELANVSKIYRRYGGKQFATLKSALLQRSLVRDLRPSETFPALTDVSFSVPKGSTFARHRTERLREEHGAQAGGRHHEADDGQRAGRRADFRAHRARRRIPSRNLGARERVHQRDHAGPDEASDSRSLRRHRRLRGAPGIHRRARQDVFVRHVHAPGIRGGDSRRARRAPRRRGAGRRRRGLHAQVPGQVRRVQASRKDRSAGDALARPGREPVRRRRVARGGAGAGARRSQARRWRLPDGRRGGRTGAHGRDDGQGRRGSRGRAARRGRRSGRRFTAQHVPGRRGALGIARGGNRRRRAARWQGGAVVRVSHRRARSRSG